MSILWLLAAVTVQAGPSPNVSQPILDMHFHAYGADAMGPPGSKICAPYGPWPVRDPVKGVEDYLGRFTISPNCSRSFNGPPNDQALLRANVGKLRERNIIAVASGPASHVKALHDAAPERPGTVRDAAAIGPAPVYPIAPKNRHRCADRPHVPCHHSLLLHEDAARCGLG